MTRSRKRGELAFERGALAFQRAEGLGLLLQLLLPAAHAVALLGQAAADILFGARPSGQLRADPLVLPAGGTAIGRGRFLFRGGLLSPQQGLRPLVLGAGAARVGVGQTLVGEREVAVQLAQLDSHGRQTARDVRPLSLGGGTGASRLFTPVLRFGHARARGGQQIRQLREPRLHVGHIRAEPLEQPAGEGELHREPLLGQLRVALRLAALARQAPDLRLDLGDQVLHPLKVHRGLFQATLGAVLAVAVEPDAGRLFEQRSPLVGPVGEEKVDHLGFDDHAGVAAEAGAAEQILDVPEPDRSAVQEIVALAGAGEPAGHHDFAVGDRQVAVAVVEEEGDLGDVDRPAGGGALEDDVFHLAAAEQAGRLLAQDPAHRVGDVRLAAAVGTDDGGHAFLEGQRDGVGEGLESGELELGQLHEDLGPVY